MKSFFDPIRSAVTARRLQELLALLRPMAVVIALLTSGLLQAEPCLLSSDVKSLHDCASALEDRKHEFSFDTIDAEPFSLPLTKSKQVGYTQSAWWVRLQLKAEKNRPFSGTLIVAPQGCDRVDVRLRSSTGSERTLQLGDNVPFYEREVDSRLQSLRVHLEPAETLDVMLRYETTNGLRFPLQIYEEHAYERHNANERLLYGIYFGILFVMLLYNAVLFLVVRDAVSVDYLNFLVAFALGVTSLTGFAYEYFWPDAVYWTDRAHPFFMNIALFFGIRFIQRYIDSARYAHLLDVILSALRYVALLLAIVSIGPYVRTVSILTQAVVLLSVPVIFVVSVRGLMLKVRPARYLMTAWVLLLSGAFLYALASVGVLPYNLFTSNMLLFGSAVDMLIFSLGLGERYSQLRVTAREYEMQLEIARNLQKSLLPALPESVGSTELQYAFRPMHLVGGDFLDILDTKDGLGLFICDVSGHGIGASLLSSMVKMSLSGFWSDCADRPAEVIGRLYRSLTDKFGDQYLTACAVWIDRRSGRLRYARAGHEEPILLRADGSIEYLNAPGTILHTMFYVPATPEEITMSAGDTLLLFTDGLTQALNRQLVSFGEAELIPLLLEHRSESLSLLCERIVRRLDAFTDHDFRDDLALLIYRHN
jgi:hypothetical protein